MIMDAVYKFELTKEEAEALRLALYHLENAELEKDQRSTHADMDFINSLYKTLPRRSGPSGD